MVKFNERRLTGKTRPPAAMPAEMLEPTYIAASSWRQGWVVASLFIGLVGSYLILKSLDSTYFWDDEAEVAIFARNFVHKGELTGWDGRNLFAFRNGTTLDDQLMSRQPPLMFYLTAASFALFGESTATGRLPHALLGIVAMVLMWRVLRREFPGRPHVAVYGLATLAGCLTFILAARTCRYLSICVAGTLVVYEFYSICRQRDAGWAYVGLALSAAALFFGHYLVGAVFLMGLAVSHGLLYARDLGLRRNLRLAGAGVLCVALILPYSVKHEIWVRNDMYPSMAPWYISHPVLTWLYVRDINRINVLPWLAVLGLVAICVSDKHWRKPVLMQLGLAVAYVLIMGIFTPQPYRPGKPADVRYLIGATAPALAALGMGLAWLHERSRAAAVVGLLLLVFTNVWTVPEDFKYQLMLPDYVREIHRPYPTADELAVQAVRELARQDDLVLTVPDYQTLPLIFYLGGKIRICCVVNNVSPLAQVGARRFANHIFIQDNFPDWILGFAHEAELDMVLGFMSRPHQENGVPRQYRYEFVRRLGSYYRNTQRPEVPSHSFGPRQDYDVTWEDVYLFKKTVVM